MQFDIDNLSGGIKNWLQAFHLQANEAVDLLNADVHSGAIQPMTGRTPAATTPDILKYRTPTRSVVKWSGQYYWSDNDTGALNSTLGYMGIIPPASVPVITEGPRGTRFTGTYRYLATYATDDGFESSSFYLTTDPADAYATFNADRTVIEMGVGDYPTFDPHRQFPGNPLRLGYEVGERVVYNGVAYEAIQVVKDYPYTEGMRPEYWPPNQTYWDLTPPTVVSTGFDTLTVTVPISTQYGVTKINVYRTPSSNLASGIDFYLVATLTGGTHDLVDAVSDKDLLVREHYTLEPLLPPVYTFSNQLWQQVGGKYLTELNGTFYLAYGDRVYLSEQNDPHSWHPLKYVNFDSTVTAIARHDTAVIVYTGNRTYRLSGTTLADLVRTDLQVAQGCPNWRSIAYFRNMPIWMSNDGLCGYSNVPNQEGKYVSVLTDQRYKFATQPLFCEVANDVYHAFCADHALCFDFKNGLLTYRVDLVADDAFFDQNADSLLIHDADTWYAATGGDTLTWSYTSPDFTGGKLLDVKHWKRVWVDCDGSVSMTIYLNGTEQTTITDVGATARRWMFLPAGLTGARLQLKFTGTGTLRGYQIEVVPKQ